MMLSVSLFLSGERKIGNSPDKSKSEVRCDCPRAKAISNDRAEGGRTLL